MIKYHISQYGKPTIRYSFKESMKVMHDRKLTKGDRGLLRVTCDSIEEAQSILSSRLYKPHCTMVFAYYGVHKLYWFQEKEWVDANRFFSDDDDYMIDDFFDKINNRQSKLDKLINDK